MSVIEIMIGIPVEYERDVCGQFDTYLKKIERTLHMTMIVRDDEIEIIRSKETVSRVKSVFSNLTGLSGRSNTITGQNVDYILPLSFAKSDGQILGIDEDVMCQVISSKPVKPKVLRQKRYVDVVRKRMIVLDTRSAGTGKIYLTMAIAIQIFKNDGVGRIILTRSAIKAGEKLEFLSGDLRDKIDPYLRPLYDALYQIMGAESYLHSPKKGFIEMAPLAYVRRRTLDNACIILDEAQNTTPTQTKMSLTRIGFGSEVIMTGDQTQKNLPGSAVSSLDTALRVLRQVDDIGFYYLTGSDVVCHPSIQKTVQTYETYERKNTPPAGRRGIREQN